ncbi:FkbM family methyltransferase [Streptomonospora sp. PA3]|uniref:FkbM family methyltransferase n=1 Tax=Streptomonospora sp. PA3 TaxID=2607326 RepID=UPI0012DE17E6|nr:FkbM family methyltransferase [Streptomonospora sp. PA3]MUL42886.1 FkbM family methyltransferase [Streptomonospora sp. PA3]
MPTLKRRILDALPRANIHVRNLEPGTALLSRRDAYRVSRIGPTSWLVSRNRDPFAKALSRAIGKSARRPRRVVPFGPDSHLLVADDQDAEGEWHMHKAAHDYLAERHVASLLRDYRVNCVFDVGANVGQYARRLRKHGYTGRIVSFEPVSAIAEKLREAAADDPDWWVYPCALGREERVDTINVVQGSMSSLLGPSEFGTRRYKRFRKTAAEEIAVRRLDAVMDEALKGIDDPRPYLKLDTQGYDLEAFAGAGARTADLVGLQSEVALMQIYEGMPRMQEAITVYEDDGFEITGMFPVTREQATGRVLEFDCVMVRADSLPE